MNKIKDSFSKVKARDEFKSKLIINLQSSSIEKKQTVTKKDFRPVAATAAVLLFLIGAVSYKLTIVNRAHEQAISIPKIELPRDGVVAKMMPLIVYNGRVYTMSSTIIQPEDGKKLLGEKLGTTKGNIDEWSKQDEYSKEFASTVGIQDVYTVKGYDKNFRIITYLENADGTSYPQFYDCLNGITVKSGGDIFKKLNIKGNIVEAKFRSFSDWNNGLEASNDIKDLDLLNKFFSEVNKATPYLFKDIEATLGDYQNDEGYREISLSLKDGSKVNFSILKSGYVHYGPSNIYFKVEGKIIEELWNQLSIKL